MKKLLIAIACCLISAVGYSRWDAHARADYVENRFKVGESAAVVNAKLELDGFRQITHGPNQIYASKSERGYLWGFDELRVILSLENDQVSKVWVKRFSHTL